MLASRPSGPLPGRDHATPPGKVVNSTHSGDDALTAPPSAPALESECSAPSSSGRFSPPSSPAPWWPRAPPPAGRPARLTWPGPARSARKRWFSRLPPRDVSGLHALAGRGGRLSPQVREARRHQALGGLARAAQVADTVQSLGLQVVGSSETSVTASGSAQQLQTLSAVPGRVRHGCGLPSRCLGCRPFCRGWSRSRLAATSRARLAIRSINPPRGPFGRRVAANLRRPRPERGHC